jgi:CBS-domain-containing membrane protein
MASHYLLQALYNPRLQLTYLFADSMQGAAAILEFNAIESPFAQPRNSIVGHFISAVIGVGVTKLFLLNSDAEDLRWLAGAVACGLASAGMALTETIHPPAGATALLAAVDPQVQQLGWYLLPLVLLSSAITLVISLLLNNIQRQYPMYWWTPADLGKKKMGNDIEEKSTSSSTTSLGPKLLQHVEDTGQPMIRITRERIVVPDHIYLASEERKILEILHQRLEDGLPRQPGPAVQP